MKKLFDYSKNKFILAAALFFLAGILKVVLLQSFLAEEADLSYWVPIFVLIVIALLQFIFIKLIYNMEAFTSPSEAPPGVSRELILSCFFIFGWIIEFVGAALFLHSRLGLLLAGAAEGICLPFFILLHCLALKNQLKIKENYLSILLNYGIIFMTITVAAKPVLMNGLLLFFLLLAAICYSLWEIKRNER